MKFNHLFIQRLVDTCSMRWRARDMGTCRSRLPCKSISIWQKQTWRISSSICAPQDLGCSKCIVRFLPFPFMLPSWKSRNGQESFFLLDHPCRAIHLLLGSISWQSNRDYQSKKCQWMQSSWWWCRPMSSICTWRWGWRTLQREKRSSGIGKSRKLWSGCSLQSYLHCTWGTSFFCKL